MPCTMPRSVTSRPSGTLVSAMMPSMAVAILPKSSPKRADIDVDSTAQFIVVHFRGRCDARDVADHIEPVEAAAPVPRSGMAFRSVRLLTWFSGY